ncbi:MAG: ATP-binding cassette domain-containing protein [Candidatus Thioglobus sp.]|nr:MAG: ATP-binding cassette domain-containing protein [Candidatus Thioglobus sp.]
MDGVSKSFSSPGAGSIPVFQNLSLQFEPNQLHVVMGASGCGKSTLGYLLAGFIPPDQGSIGLGDKLVKDPGPERLLVFQETALWPWMTVLENVIFGPKVRGDADAASAKSAAQALLLKFGLAEFSDKYPDQLSGGMKRRAEIAQALINRPEVMILDEPFRGLDVMTREILQEYYLDLFEETRQTTVFITSELEEALFLADKIYIMGGQPARILDVIDIDLPRPRDFEVTVSKKYLEYKERAIKQLFQSEES